MNDKKSCANCGRGNIRIATRTRKLKLGGRRRQKGTHEQENHVCGGGCRRSCQRLFGVDDTGACVDFLVSEKYWAKSGSGRIDAHEFQVSLFRDKLVETIDSKGWTDRLHQITEKVWNGIESQLEGKRKPKYGERQ